MTEFITADRTANAIMQKADYHKSFLIVEGKTDYYVYNKFINHNDCSIEIAFGNDNVIEVLSKLKQWDFHNALGIIDSDFRVLDEEEVTDENIIQTDFHDLEIMLIKSESFDIVMGHYVQANKLADNYGDYAGLRDYLFQISKHIGYLKWLNKKKGYGLLFKPKSPEGKHIDYSNFISVKNLKFDGYRKLIETIFNFCNGKVPIKVKMDHLENELKQFIKDCDLDHLCNGHDVIHIIALSLKKHVSNMNSKAVSVDQISKELGLAYEARFFEQTYLYQRIREWEVSKQKPVLSF